MTEPGATAQDRNRWLRSASACAGLIALLVLPHLISTYNTFNVTLMMIASIAILGLNIVTGYSGQISIGHGAFYAAGAYLTAILATQAGIPYWLDIPLAGLVCLGLGTAFGFPALRLEGHYLALATFCLAIAVPTILKANALMSVSKGVQGIMLPRVSAPAWLHMAPDMWVYHVTLLVGVIMFILASMFLRGRNGRALLAIRDHALAASAMGIDVARAKTMAFGVSAAYAAVAGALSAVATRYVAPDSFDVFLSISFLVGAVVGGLSTLPGSIIGGIFIITVPNLAQNFSQGAPWAIYGGLLIACMLVLPNGLWGAAVRLFQRVREPRRAEARRPAASCQATKSPVPQPRPKDTSLDAKDT